MASELTIDGLARESGLPVRTIREYNTLRLLPPPSRRGRVGLYGARHAERLELIARLQRRGYSLAGIRDLLDAWDVGGNLSQLLGVEAQPAPLDEAPLRLTRAELLARLPGPDLDPERACAAGLAQPDGEHYLVRSPALLALVADGVGAGLTTDEMLALATALTSGLGSVARTLAGLIADGLLRLQAAHPDQPEDVRALLQRGRSLLTQAAASILTDRLAAALLDSSRHAAGGEALREAIEQIRVGAVADAAGRLQRRETGKPGR